MRGDLNALTIFARVAQANSCSGAARRLKMLTSPVSRRIAELEQQLGVRLLERSTLRRKLAEVGAEILERAGRGAELSDAVHSIVSNQRSGLLHVSVPPSIADTLLVPLISAFQVSYPAARVQILVTARLADHLAEGVGFVFRVGTLKDSSLVASAPYLEHDDDPTKTSRSISGTLRCGP